MTAPRRAAAGLAALAVGAVLLLTGCGPAATAPSKANQQVSGTAGTDDATLKDMQQKVDAAESVAAQADSDATRNN